MAQTKVKTKGITDTNVTNAKLGTDISAAKLTAGTVATARLGSGTASSSTVLYGDQTYKTEPTYDDNQLQSNVAMLGFKVAVNGSLTRYNLVDQSIDEFYDTSGVDASASTNEQRVASGSNFYYWGASGSNPTGATSTDTSVAGYTTLVLSAASGNIVVGSGGNVDVLVVGGGGSGGSDYGGGGGAGGLIYKTGHALTAQTYAWVTGAGGATSTAAGGGNNGADSTWTDASASVEFTAKGGGSGASESTGDVPPAIGGSGGGGGYYELTGAAANQGSQSGDSGTYGFGFAGGNGKYSGSNRGGGGGGAGAVGTAGADTQLTTTGAGGVGKDYSAIFGTALGASGWFAGGGGGGAGSASYQIAGAGGTGGGTAGSYQAATTAGQANTGGGSGGCGNNSSYGSGAGGSGIILLRYADGAFQTTADLTLQSTDVTAGTAPTYGEFVTLIENAAGTATLNTDIKGYISRDSGTTFTQGTLVDEGTWGTNKKVLGFHDLDISSQPSGTSMCYKITTHNQSGAKETRIYASSIGWR